MSRLQIPAPGPMDTSGDVSSNWRHFKDSFNDYLIATKLNEEDEKVQVATLRSILGKDARTILQHLELSDDNRGKVKETLDALEKYFVPQTNVVYERYIFRCAVQGPGETFDIYIARLRKLASSCNYGALEEEMIRDNIVYGILNDSVRARLLREKDMSLATAIDICRSSERADSQAKSIKKTEEATVNYTRRKVQTPKGNIKDCKFCGKSHAYDRNKCPAFGKICKKCSKQNHFASCCKELLGKIRPKKNKESRERNVHAVANEDSSEEDYCYTVTNSTSKKYTTTVSFVYQGKSTSVKCQLDTGASRNTMPLAVYKSIVGMEGNLRPSNTKLRTYNGGVIVPVGFDRLLIESNTTQVKAHIEVVPDAPITLLSGNTCEKLKLIAVNEEFVLQCTNETTNKLTKAEVLEHYKDNFNGLGNIGTLKIRIDDSVKPVQNYSRRVPVPLQSELKSKLEQMEAEKIICKVTTPTPWINNMVAVKTASKLRVCLDPQQLNKAIRRNHFPIKTLEELSPKLKQAKLFTVVDAKDGFNQIVLDEESSFLTTFWTPFGRYRWLRLPFGINSAPEEFYMILQQRLEGLENVEVIADDILIYGSGDTVEEAEKSHDKAFKAFMERANEKKLKLNAKKLKFKMTAVTYMGHIVSADGLQADPAKIKAIKEMPLPKDMAAVQRLLGMVNYLSKFTPHLSSVCEPLRRLLDKDRPFDWLPQHDKAVQDIKQLICDAPTLKYFDSTKPTVIECDASSVGLGAVLLQEDQPVAFASRALSTTEKNYAPIEAEALAVVFACEHFDSYILGKQITVFSDHKPLETILNKSILKAPKRLQRMRLRLQRYDLTVKHKPGKNMFLSDTLSRASLPSSEDVLSDQSPMIYHLGSVSSIAQKLEEVKPTEGISICDERLEKIKQAYEDDPSMQQLKEAIMKGWPENRLEVPILIRDYWSYKDELSLFDGILFRGTCVIIPSSMRSEMIEKSHQAHQGIEATIKFARDVIYWPQMRKHLEEVCKQCKTCNAMASAQIAEPMMSYPIPDHPYQMISSDIFSWEGKHYIVAVCHYSDYIDVQPIKDISTKETITFFESIFQTHGIPLLLISDNGTNYTSNEFKEFCTEYGIHHITSSPHHHQSNGRAENAVKVAKNLLKRAQSEKKPLWVTLLAQRNTPSKGMDSSPVQRIMSRRTRTTLPATRKSYSPMVIADVKEKLKLRKQQNKFYKDQNRREKSLPELIIGQPVRVKTHPQLRHQPWVPGEISRIAGPRAYDVNIRGQGVLTRNRIHIRETAEPTPKQGVASEIPEVEQPKEIQTQPNTTEVRTRSGRVIKQPERYM